MNKIVPFWGLVAIIGVNMLSLNSCGITAEKIKGNGEQKDSTVALSGFNSVNIAGRFDVQISKSNTSSLKITGDANILPYISVTQNGSELAIKFNKTNIDAKLPIQLIINAADYEKISLSGANSLINNTNIQLNHDFQLTTSGSNNVDLNLNTKKFELKGSGSSHIKLNGSADKTNIALSGSNQLDFSMNTKDLKMDGSGSSSFVLQGEGENGSFSFSGSTKFDGQNYPLKNVTINTAGSSNALLNVSKSLSADLKGSSIVKYSGTPEIKVKSGGSASIEKL